MNYTILGRTNLSVSVMGLGCGGHSRLGTSTGHTEDEAERVVKEALSLGVNFIDTAEGYHTESIVGRALAGTPRDAVVISTKAGVHWHERLCTAAELNERIEACLHRLQTDYIDVFHLHGVSFEDYPYALHELVPSLQRLRHTGKIRYIGITEAFGPDPGHRMLVRALEDDCWDVMMVGFNILNQSARERVIMPALPRRIGILCMFAARRALSNPEALRLTVAELVSQQLVDPDEVDLKDPLGFLMQNGVATSLPDAAYRFCLWEPGVHVVLSGTGNIDHLRANASSLAAMPIPLRYRDRLCEMFARVDTISGN